MTTKHYVRAKPFGNTTYRIEVTGDSHTVIYSQDCAWCDYTAPYPGDQDWCENGVKDGSLLRVSCRAKAKRVVGR